MVNEEPGRPEVGPEHEELAPSAGGPDLPAGEDDIPPAPLWAMWVRMDHRRLEPGEEGRIRRRLGDGDDALYVIDDGLDHCMVGRRVGHTPDGCTYCLVARISVDLWAELEDGEVDGADVFSEARDISLCGVFEAEDAASNVFLVQHYRKARSVPSEYLPPSPFIEFADEAGPEPD